MAVKMFLSAVAIFSAWVHNFKVELKVEYLFDYSLYNWFV